MSNLMFALHASLAGPTKAREHGGSRKILDIIAVQVALQIIDLQLPYSASLRVDVNRPRRARFLCDRAEALKSFNLPSTDIDSLR